MNLRKHKYSVIVNDYNKPSDRFVSSGYGDPSNELDILQLVECAGKQGLVEGVELLLDARKEADHWFGIGHANWREVRRAADEYGLELCSIMPNLAGHRRLAKGSIGSPDPKIRRECIDLCKCAVDVASEVGCPYVGLWPGQDGFDYYLEIDYQRMWAAWVEGLQEIADHNPDIRVGLEPKPDEPRAYSFISTVPKTLLMIADIGRENVGLCLDIGHSLYGHENLGEVVALTQAKGKLFHLHMNDNYNSSDLDMIFGSVHTLEFIELFYWLRRIEYSGFLSVDLFAYRTDPSSSIAESVEWMRAFDRLIDGIGLSKLTELIENGDPVVTTRFLREKLLGSYSLEAS